MSFLDRIGRKFSFMPRNSFLFQIGQTGNHIHTNTVTGQARAYLTCPVVMSVVNKKAQSIQNAKVWAVNEKNEDAKNDGLIKVMSQPNPHQSLMKFVGLTNAFVNIFGKAYWYKVQAVGMNAMELYVIPNTLITEVTKAVGTAGEILTPYSNVSHFEVSLFGNVLRLERDEVEIINDNTSELITIFGSVSRLVTLEEQVNTFNASYEATTELMVNRGVLGVISLTDPTGTTPAAFSDNIPQIKSEKDNVQKELSKYGALRSQFKYIVTNLASSFTPVSSSIKDLGASDAQKNAKKDIAYSYGVPSILLDVEGSTYANMSEAKKVLYDDAIIPEANSIFESLNKVYDNTVVKVMPFYDHLECYQEAKRAQAAGYTSLVNGINQAVSTGLLTTEEGRTRLLNYES